MIVIPKQKKYRAILVDYTEKMFIEIGRYMHQDAYRLDTDERRYTGKALKLIFNNETIEPKHNSYILVDVDNNRNFTYIEENDIDDYIEIKD